MSTCELRTMQIALSMPLPDLPAESIIQFGFEGDYVFITHLHRLFYHEKFKLERRKIRSEATCLVPEVTHWHDEEDTKELFRW